MSKKFKSDAQRRAAFANMKCTRVSKADVVANNISVGSILDTRTPLAITDDMRKESEQVVCSPADWMKNKSRKDLIGWDDTTIPKHADRFDSPHKKIEGELKNMFPNTVISGRVKTIPSLVGKLKTKNKSDPPFIHTDMEDISGLRITFDNISELKKAMPLISKKYNVTEIEDYVRSPKKGYRSVHMMIYSNGLPTELQLRTERMTVWADRGHDNIYKESKLFKSLSDNEKASVHKYSMDMSKYFAALDSGKSAKKPYTPPIVKNKMGEMRNI